ncbi:MULTISPECIES: methyl-accepting chemotaxis protein [unclassified Brevundimonas]|uniref:methyl-accepting chemotaxis protein n=1 Tax=unclassified Brevundimonas TaxID=2622653 RepID=UPI000CFCAD57|nr:MULTISPECIES: methyl-accepting chemotaxis protein [unclassified Brevundimonas]PRA26424.1 chemotaxis protein [Brevundimonas sp. MYb27]PQZ75865.1 chemotaxis protein [Brevundimonas sp. MYb31]PRB11573.1 chemotaxis protein [Brevundimonas sp. MYb52]PRB32715.1 chemotaxis protein [Brevundimonas sp. MYb46]PRB45723.1 chemotaxis protein [Brevundimonas sp. MYb33]
MLQNLSVPKKLMLSFAAVIAACGMATLVVLWAVTVLQKADAANAASAEMFKASDLVLASAVEQQNAMRAFVATRDADFIPKYEEPGKVLVARLADLAAADVNAAYGQEQAALKGAVDAFHQSADGLIALARDPATQPQAVAGLEAGARLSDIRAAISSIQDKETVVAAANAKAKAFAYKEAYWSFAIGGVVALIIALGAIAWLIGALSRPVEAMTRAMGRLAAGDLNVAIPAIARRDEIGHMAAAVLTFKQNAEEKVRLEAEAEVQRAAAEQARIAQAERDAEMARQQAQVVDGIASGLDRLSNGQLAFRLNTSFAPEYEKLRADFNGAMAKLQSTMGVIVDRSSAIGASAHEISQASNDLSRRTEQQAAALEETAAALEQITATVARSAENAVEAGGVVKAARSEAVEGQAVVGRAVTAMGEIERSSNEIGNIIGVIDEIAFQTNLLALNAGVEAARAGDAGRGFAVVASEVRALAQRSAEAAKEIKTLISASSRQVGEGVQLVGDTGEALKRIGGQIERVTAITGEIVASSQEQSSGLQQVNVAVNQMDQVTQQNAAMVEEATAASHSLAQDARELDRMMGQFSLEDAAMDARGQQRMLERAVA